MRVPWAPGSTDGRGRGPGIAKCASWCFEPNRITRPRVVPCSQSVALEASPSPLGAVFLRVGPAPASPALREVRGARWADVHVHLTFSADPRGSWYFAEIPDYGSQLSSRGHQKPGPGFWILRGPDSEGAAPIGSGEEGAERGSEKRKAGERPRGGSGWHRGAGAAQVGEAGCKLATACWETRTAWGPLDTR